MIKKSLMLSHNLTLPESKTKSLENYNKEMNYNH